MSNLVRWLVSLKNVLLLLRDARRLILLIKKNVVANKSKAESVETPKAESTKRPTKVTAEVPMDEAQDEPEVESIERHRKVTDEVPMDEAQDEPEVESIERYREVTAEVNKAESIKTSEKEELLQNLKQRLEALFQPPNGAPIVRWLIRHILRIQYKVKFTKKDLDDLYSLIKDNEDFRTELPKILISSKKERAKALLSLTSKLTVENIKTLKPIIERVASSKKLKKELKDEYGLTPDDIKTLLGLVDTHEEQVVALLQELAKEERDTKKVLGLISQIVTTENIDTLKPIIEKVASSKKLQKKLQHNYGLTTTDIQIVLGLLDTHKDKVVALLQELAKDKPAPKAVLESLSDIVTAENINELMPLIRNVIISSKVSRDIAKDLKDYGLTAPELSKYLLLLQSHAVPSLLKLMEALKALDNITLQKIKKSKEFFTALQDLHFIIQKQPLLKQMMDQMLISASVQAKILDLLKQPKEQEKVKQSLLQKILEHITLDERKVILKELTNLTTMLLPLLDEKEVQLIIKLITADSKIKIKTMPVEDKKIIVSLLEKINENENVLLKIQQVLRAVCTVDDDNLKTIITLMMSLDQQNQAESHLDKTQQKKQEDDLNDELEKIESSDVNGLKKLVQMAGRLYQENVKKEKKVAKQETKAKNAQRLAMHLQYVDKLREFSNNIEYIKELLAFLVPLLQPYIDHNDDHFLQEASITIQQAAEVSTLSADAVKWVVQLFVIRSKDIVYHAVKNDGDILEGVIAYLFGNDIPMNYSSQQSSTAITQKPAPSAKVTHEPPITYESTAAAGLRNGLSQWFGQKP